MRRLFSLFISLAFLSASSLALTAGAAASLPAATVLKPQEARVVRATLSPDSAQIVESGSLAVAREASGAARVTILLPRAADPASLVLSGEGGVTGVEPRWREIQPGSGEALGPAAKEAESMVRVAREKRDAERVKLETVGARIEAWQSRLRPLAASGGFNAADVEGLEKASAAALGPLFAERARLGVSLEDAEKALAEAIRRRDEIIGASALWEVSVRLKGLPGGAAPEKYAGEWRYEVPGCGWRPAYRLEGFTEDKSVRLTMEAEAWQATGADWRDVELSLVTARPAASAQPPFLRPWVVGPQPKMAPVMAPAPQVMRQKSLDMAAESAAGMMMEEAPVREVKSAFDVWSLGRKSLPSGDRQRFALTETSFPASFDYLLRPAVSSAAFVRAEITRETDLDLPSGPAIVHLDGGYLGQRQFSLKPGDKNLYFGIDPRISGVLRTVERKTDEKGLIGKERSLMWKYEIVLRNAKSAPARVRVEEAKPRATDERVQIAVTGDPQPVEETPGAGDASMALLVWNLDLPPDSKGPGNAKSGKVLRFEVRARAPADVPLESGR